MQESDDMLESHFQNFMKQVEEKMASTVANLMAKSGAIAMDSANLGTDAGKQTGLRDAKKNNTKRDASARSNKATREKKFEHLKKKCKHTEDSSDSSSESDDNYEQGNNDDLISLSCDNEDELMKELNNDLENDNETVTGKKVSQPIAEHVNKWFTKKLKESKLKKFGEKYSHPKNSHPKH